MYTEENEFDYDNYLAENEDGGSNNSSFNKNLITKIILIAICIILIIFLFFMITKNFKKEDKKENNSVDSSLVFNNNINLLKDVAIDYFFGMENYPKEVGENKLVSVKELIDGKLLTEMLDYDKKACGYNTSYISMTRNKNDYMLEIYLNCPSNEEKLVYYYDLKFNCLTCNGEAYISSNDDENNGNNEDSNQDTNNNNQDNNSNNENNNNNDSNNNDNSNNNSNNNNGNNNDNGSNSGALVCKGEFGAWTTEFINDDTLEREERVVVKGYKDNITYGPWSSETTTPITSTSNLQVYSETRSETTTSLSGWSQVTTKKPSSKEGRTINSWTESEPYYETECKNQTYTVNRTTWDNSANKCTSTGIGKVTCTYTKKVCNDVKKYKSVKYYQYQDTVTETKDVTYYKSREIIKGTPSITDYILESEMPVGYTKLPNSEVKQYRYKTKCVK